MWTERAVRTARCASLRIWLGDFAVSLARVFSPPQPARRDPTAATLVRPITAASLCTRRAFPRSTRPQPARDGDRELAGEGVRAGDDLEDLLRDLGLAGAVQREREVVDQLTGVLRGVPHRGHLRGEERGRRLEQRAVDLRLE